MEKADQQALGKALEEAYGRYDTTSSPHDAPHYARLWDHLLDALKEGTVDVDTRP